MQRRLSDAARAAHRRRFYLRRKAMLELEAIVQRTKWDAVYAAAVRERLLLLAKAAGL